MWSQRKRRLTCNRPRRRHGLVRSEQRVDTPNVAVLDPRYRLTRCGPQAVPVRCFHDSGAGS
jgi:hypothetical protein